MKSKLPKDCPCGLGKAYAQCCQPLHQGAAASSAEALMRSRYSAFVLDLWDYLAHTWHPATRPPDLTEGGHPASRWLGLKIRQQRPLSENQWEVEFVARYRKPDGQAVRLHEISRFERIDGRWLYCDGVIKDR